MGAIHENIRNIRNYRNLSQQDMAEHLEMSVSAYGKIERGETMVIHHKLEKIAEILGVNILDLLKGDCYNSFNNFQDNASASAIGVIQNQNNYNGDDKLFYKIELLENELKHQQEIIEAKNKEIELLRKILEK